MPLPERSGLSISHVDSGEQRGQGGVPHSLFLQEVHLHPSHLQESVQVQEPPREGEAQKGLMRDSSGLARCKALGQPQGPLGWSHTHLGLG